jgi:hypothetical protein
MVAGAALGTTPTGGGGQQSEQFPDRGANDRAGGGRKVPTPKACGVRCREGFAPFCHGGITTGRFLTLNTENPAVSCTPAGCTNMGY